MINENDIENKFEIIKSDSSLSINHNIENLGTIVENLKNEKEIFIYDFLLSVKDDKKYYVTKYQNHI